MMRAHLGYTCTALFSGCVYGGNRLRMSAALHYPSCATPWLGELSYPIGLFLAPLVPDYILAAATIDLHPLPACPPACCCCFAPAGAAMMYSHPATCSVYIKHLPEEVGAPPRTPAVAPAVLQYVCSADHDAGGS
jgi:hypothetical protein